MAKEPDNPSLPAPQGLEKYIMPQEDPESSLLRTIREVQERQELERKQAQAKEQEWDASNGHLFPGANLPAFYVNRFHFVMNGGLARIAFGESWFGESMRPSVNITMTVTDVKELIRSLSELIEQIEKDQAARLQAQKDGEPT
jgi:hypothetical protein